MYGWRIGAPPTPRFGVSEARMKTPGAKMRRGNEEVCVFEIVRPGMEDSESAEKQENTGIGPASACRGESAAGRRRAICMVSFAARDVRPHPEERGCRDVSQTRTRVRASRRMRTAAGWPSCFETHHSAFGVRKRLRSRRAAMLLSMRARGRARFGETKPTVILAKRTQRRAFGHLSSPRKRGPMITVGGYGSRLSLRSAGTTIAWSARRTNLRLCEMAAGAISLFPDCYLQ